MVAAALALAGCGSESDYANDPRPPTPINISASISPDKVTVSPQQFGAGPVTFLIANLTDDTQTVTVETQDLAQKAGIKQTSSVINPQGTATLKVDVAEGEYTVSVDSASIQEAHISVGAERESSQDQLLQP
jgi:anti-sigma28 factor (negative regulator of flagellin synthesis)